MRARARTAVVRFLAVRTGWRSRTAVWARTFTTKSRPTQAASACSSASPVRPVASAGAEPEELVWLRCVAAPVVRGTGQARTDAQQPTHRCMRMRMAENGCGPIKARPWATDSPHSRSAYLRPFGTHGQPSPLRLHAGDKSERAQQLANEFAMHVAAAQVCART